MIRTFGTAVLAMGFLFTGIVRAQQPKPQAVAVVNGESIAIEDVEKAAAQDIRNLEVRKLQFEIEMERDRKSAMENALEEVIKDRVLAAEASKRNVSVDDLIAIEIDSAIPNPSDEAVVAFYNTNKASLEGSLADNVSAIRKYLRNDQRQGAFDAFVARLTKDYAVKSFLEPFRTTIEITGRPSKGPANASVTIVEFSDFECPYCRALFPTLQKIETDYEDRLRVVYLQFPLASMHTHAKKAAEASLCAYEQDKFWQLHDAMFNDQQNLSVDDLKSKAAKLSLDTTAFNACLDSDKYLEEIQSDMEEGVKAGVSGTPAMFINGRVLIGSQPYGDIQKIIEDELRRSAAN